MPEQHDVKILQWPSSNALLEHRFQLDEPCPVAIIFDEKPAMVKVTATPEQPVHMKMDMDMDMNVRAREPFPVCIRICEPICAVSDYTVGLNLLGQPLLQIAVKGTTTLGDCKPERERTTCVDFAGRKPQETVPPPLNVGIVSITPLAEEGTLQMVSFISEPEKIQLLIPDRGLRFRFAQPVADVRMKVASFGGPVLEATALSAGVVTHSAAHNVGSLAREILVPGDSIDTITLKGGSNEAVLIEICYSRGRAAGSSPTGPDVTLI
ncbi:hypothetical protein [Lewinella sp. IMCC34183]|uniref:hypothetical protein n=1 Tax=Lewinella sp. IMCC34183 TaxID=2248762 RepID=UPI000E224619|nr:hypothetical protein [Lewinella sp. IMCC34183]